MAVDPLQTPQLVSAMGKADVAIGSRSVPGSSVESDNFRRAVMGRTFSRYVNALTGLGIRDTQCGFKAFHTPAARLLFHCMVIDRFAFDVDLLYLARRLNLRVAEVPIHWRDVDGSAVRPVVDPFSMVLDVLRMRMGRKPPPIPALSVSISASGRGESSEDVPALLIRAFGRTLPIVQFGPGRSLVLFPLCSAGEVPRRVPRIHELVPGADVRDQLVSIRELIGLGPARLLARGGTGQTRVLDDEPPELAPLGEECIRLSVHDSPSNQDQESLPLPGT